DLFFEFWRHSSKYVAQELIDYLQTDLRRSEVNGLYPLTRKFIQEATMLGTSRYYWPNVNDFVTFHYVIDIKVVHSEWSVTWKQLYYVSSVKRARRVNVEYSMFFIVASNWIAILF